MLEKYRLNYRGRLVWLIFWIIVFFPIALFLLFAEGEFLSPEEKLYFEYDGSRFWFGYWLLVFFPVALLLLALNGLAMVRQRCYIPGTSSS